MEQAINSGKKLTVSVRNLICFIIFIVIVVTTAQIPI